MTDNLIEVTKLRKEFGGLVATNDIDFTIPRASIVSLIGPNGAGKTTFFNQLTGVYKPTSGTILFDGVDVTDKPPHAITELGIGRTFQNIRLFNQMTAIENVLVGMHSRLKGGIIGSILLGLFADASVNAAGKDGVFFGGGWGLFGEQVLAVAVVFAFSFVVSAAIGLALRGFMPKGIRVTEEEEQMGLDITEHSETAYALERV